MQHYKEVVQETAPVFKNDKTSETISMFEIYYALTKPDTRQPSEELEALTRKVNEKKVIVVDRANRVPQVIKDYLYNTASGIVIMLG
jgi:hypothetical protein